MSRLSSKTNVANKLKQVLRDHPDIRGDVRDVLDYEPSQVKYRGLHLRLWYPYREDIHQKRVSSVGATDGTEQIERILRLTINETGVLGLIAQRVADHFSSAVISLDVVDKGMYLYLLTIASPKS